jgi:uncharacterized surface protein with fasciclin (FAS1) repeats
VTRVFESSSADTAHYYWAMSETSLRGLRNIPDADGFVSAMFKEKIMKYTTQGWRSLVLAALLAAGTASASYAADPMVGGAPMMASKTIVENASQAKTLTTLVAAVKEAGLVETLSGPGPFTVFAPTNAAFDKLPKATVEKLMQPDMKADLAKILTYHVVAGKIDAAEIEKNIKAGGGSFNMKTVEGGPLTARMDGGKVELIDAKGGGAFVETADVHQSNGVVHVIDSVLMPK